MKYEGKIGPMTCLEIKHNVVKEGSCPWHTLVLDGGEIYASSLHAFSAIRNEEEICLRARDIKSGDKIWVDLAHFMSDGSFRKNNARPVKPQTKVFTENGEILVSELKSGSSVLCADGNYHNIK